MLRNYLKIAYRNLARDRFFSLLNIFGLTTGITAFILIALFVRAELSYDTFHTKLDRMRAYKQVFDSAEGQTVRDKFSYLAGLSLEGRVPGLEEVVQVAGGSKSLFTVGETNFYEEGWLYGKDNFFKVFDFPIVEGTPRLSEPNSVVLTESTAKRYFGDREAIGQVIKFEKDTEYQVTAIMADPPANSYMQLTMLLSDKKHVDGIKEMEKQTPYAWGRTASTYFLLAEGADDETVLQNMISVADDHFVSGLFRTKEGKLRFSPAFIPYADIHLRSGLKKGISPTGDIRYVYLFSAIALLILVVACINYINLATARSLKRSKEVGLRKVIGATRSQLIGLYLTESVVLTTVSVLFAFAIAERLLPYYNQLIGRELSLSYQGVEFAFTMIFINLFVGLLAGAYPAIKLSGFNPLQAFKGGARQGKKGVRRGLVLFQLIVAQLLLVATIIIQSQLQYMQNKDLGYDKEHVFYSDTQGELEGREAVFEQAISQISGVQSMSYSSGIFTWGAISFISMKDVEGNEDSEDKMVADVFSVGRDFTNVMGLELLQGTDFAEVPSGENLVLINETGMKKFGWDNAVGKTLKIFGEPFRVVGAVKDFHNESLKATVNTAFVVLDEKDMVFANIRISPTNMIETMAEIESAWETLVPDRPFDYTFYDDKFDQHYKTEKQLGDIFFIFASLAIGISVLGLVGLTAFTTEQRLKEVGIRKVLGASLRSLILLLSNEFVWLCSIAFVIITPITYYYMQEWLEIFKYRISIDVFIYAIALVASLGVGWLVVCFQSVKAARMNPVRILRNE